jgi:hypothetical protein
MRKLLSARSKDKLAFLLRMAFSLLRARIIVESSYGEVVGKIWMPYM